MPAPGIPNACIVTPRERIAYREARAELQGWARSESAALRARKVSDLLIELNGMTAGDPWSIDEHGCLTRTVGDYK